MYIVSLLGPVRAHVLSIDHDDHDDDHWQTHSLTSIRLVWEPLSKCFEGKETHSFSLQEANCAVTEHCKQIVWLDIELGSMLTRAIDKIIPMLCIYFCQWVIQAATRLYMIS